MIQLKVLSVDLLEVVSATQQEIDAIFAATSEYNSGFRGRKFVRGDLISMFFNRKFLPMGLLKNVVNVAKKNNFQITILNKQDWMQESIELNEFEAHVKTLGLPFTPYEYQLKFAWYPIRFGRSFCEGCTSSGKTFISFLTFSYLISTGHSKKNIVVVPSKLLVDQFASDYSGYSDASNQKIKCFRLHSSAKNDIAMHEADIIVSTYQSFSKIPDDIINEVNGAYIDEAHQVAAPSLIAVVKRLRALEYRWGMTGSLPESPLAVLNIYSYLGYHFDTYKSKELIDAGRGAAITIQPIIFEVSDTVKLHFQKKLLERADPDSQVNFDLVIDVKQQLLSLEQIYTMADEERNRLLAKLIVGCTKNVLVMSKRVGS